jgi:hypothetical protein
MIRPRRKPRCMCGASLAGPRLVVHGRWMCPVCAYELEYGPVERVQRKRGPRALPQEETLFPLPPAEPPENRRRTR